MTAHYISLIAAYGATAVTWFAIDYLVPDLWKKPELPLRFKKPKVEFLYALLAVMAILVLGQLYVGGWFIPHVDHNPIDALNQLIIYSPTLILLGIRKHSSATVWLPLHKIPIRIVVGFLLALLALLTYTMTHPESNPLLEIIQNSFHVKNLSHMVQVFLEDVTIALLFVRLQAYIGTKRTILVVAFLFAAGHIPGILAYEGVLTSIVPVLLDTFLGIFMLVAISKSRDIWWFYIVHFTLDMSQFYGA